MRVANDGQTEDLAKPVERTGAKLPMLSKIERRRPNGEMKRLPCRAKSNMKDAGSQLKAAMRSEIEKIKAAKARGG